MSAGQKPAHNDAHLTNGSERGSCPESRMANSLPPYAEEEIFLRKELARKILATTRLDCTSCTGTAPGCCYQIVASSDVEARLIVDAYPRLVAERLPLLRKRAAEEREICGGSVGPQGEVFLGDETRVREGKCLQWMARRRACLFLTETGRCAIYDVRPCGCVLHHSAETPGAPEICSPDNDHAPIRALNTADVLVWLVRRDMELAPQRNLKMRYFMGLAQAVTAVVDDR